MLDRVRTCYPGRILSFDVVSQTATVQMAMERYHSNMEYFYKKVDIPPIDDVPIHFMQCGNFAMTMPIKVGDDCLIWFTYRGFDHWLFDNKMEAGTDSRGMPRPQLMRTNDISDAFATVGFNPIAKAITGFSSSALEIRSKDGSQKISLNAGGSIDIHNPSNPVKVKCTEFTVEASSGVTLDTPTVKITGALEGGSTATFAGIATAADFVMGGAFRAAANKLSEIIRRYTGHTHNYTDDGNPMVTNIQNDA